MTTIAWRGIKPDPGEFAAFYATYINRVPESDIIDTLSRQIAETVPFFRSLPESMADHTYAPGKWTIRQIIGHLSDAERVFAYRAFRFSRADQMPVEGFDENMYVANAPFARRSVDDLTSEFEHLRRASICLFNSLDENQMAMRGVANGKEISVRALAFVCAGHESHHVDFIRAHYL